MTSAIAKDLLDQLRNGTTKTRASASRNDDDDDDDDDDHVSDEVEIYSIMKICLGVLSIS